MGKLRQERRKIMADYNALKQRWGQACSDLENCTDESKRQELLKIKDECEAGVTPLQTSMRLVNLRRRCNWFVAVGIALLLSSIGCSQYIGWHYKDIDDPDIEDIRTAHTIGKWAFGLGIASWFCSVRALGIQKERRMLEGQQKTNNLGR